MNEANTIDSKISITNPKLITDAKSEILEESMNIEILTPMKDNKFSVNNENSFKDECMDTEKCKSQEENVNNCDETVQKEDRVQEIIVKNKNIGPDGKSLLKKKVLDNQILDAPPVPFKASNIVVEKDDINEDKDLHGKLEDSKCPITEEDDIKLVKDSNIELKEVGTESAIPLDDKNEIHEESPPTELCSEDKGSCDEKTSENRNVHSHNDDVDKRFKCKECNFQSNTKRLLRRHSLIHLKEKKSFKCPQCNFGTDLKNYYKVHMTKHYSMKLYSCLQCNYGANDKDSLRKHELKCHSNEKLYKCSECEYGTNSQKVFDDHKISGRKLYKCTECYYETTTKCLLKVHLLDHKRAKLFKCSECEFETKFNTTMAQHMKLVHSILTLHKCTLCSYETKYKHALTQHMTVMHPRNPTVYKCSKCEYETKNKYSLNQHVQTVHENPIIYKCTKCIYETKKKWSLNQHMTTMHSGNPTLYKCPECNHETKFKSNLKLHLLSHSTAKIHKCTECTFSTNYKYTLKKHMSLHSAPKVLKLSESESKESLQTHKLAHTNESVSPPNHWSGSETPSLSRSSEESSDVSCFLNNKKILRDPSDSLRNNVFLVKQEKALRTGFLKQKKALRTGFLKQENPIPLNSIEHETGVSSLENCQSIKI